MGVSVVLEIYKCLQQITKLLREDAEGTRMLSNDFSLDQLCLVRVEAKMCFGLRGRRFNPDTAV